MAAYFQPKSWTWRAGMVAIIIGVMQLALGGVLSPQVLQGLGYASDVIAQLTGATNADPVSLIVLGFGLIGVRRKLEQQSIDANARRSR